MHRLFRTALALCGMAAVSCAPTDPESQIIGRALVQTGENDVPFEWLDENTSKRALSWVRAENQSTLNELTSDQRFAAFEAEAVAVLTAPDRLPAIQIHGDDVYNYWQDADHVFGLWRRARYEDFIAGAPAWKTLIDFDALSESEGREWILQGVSFAPEGSSRVLVRLAHKAQDTFELREYDLDEKAFVADGFSLPESKSRVSWKDKNMLILASALDGAPKTESGIPRTLALWRRGTPPEAAEEPYFKAEFADFTAFPAFSGMTGDDFAIAQGVDFFSRAYWLRDQNEVLHPLPLPAKMAPMGIYKGALVLLLKQDWATGDTIFENGDLVLISPEGLFQRRAIENARLLYRPAADEQVRDLRVLGGVIHLNLLKSLRGRIVALDETEGGFASRLIETFADGFIRFGSTTPDGNALLATYEGPLTPPSMYIVEGGTGAKTLVAKQDHAFDVKDLREEIRYTTSKDGTEIPYTIIYHKDLALNGETPTLVYGYGGFEVTITPRYEPIFGKLWLEKGGVYVQAHLRGGGEFGPKWHDAPMLDQRPRAYEDMAAVLEELHERGVTSPAHTGIMGRSNGGLMVAAVMVRNPELMNAVVVGGPLIDMLRYDKLGPGASWTAEYGDPDNPEQRAFISGYSPIQNLKADAEYPRPLVITATYDDRVWPGHARRFSAQMEALGHDALYYEDEAGGHYWELAGGPAPGDWRKRAKARAVEYIYLARELEQE
ncbi:MAG: prolyl oligopeptidase family serine peptidase [Pseudomonadota bacterium]